MSGKQHHKTIFFICIILSINPSCKSQKGTGINTSAHAAFMQPDNIIICNPDNCEEETELNTIIKRNLKYGEARGYYASKVPQKKKNNKPAIVKEVFNILGTIRKNPRNISLYMDIYQPLDNYEEKKPVILFIHGGGFFFGDKDNQLQRELTANLIEHGCAVASINYRLGARLKGFDAIKMSIFCSVQDVRAALRYITYHADQLYIDTEKIYLAGSSSGGIIALTAAFMDEDEIFDSCKDTYFREHFGGLDNSGNLIDCRFKLAGVISLWGSVTNLDIIDKRNNIPTLLFHGTEDNILYNNHGIPLGDYLSDRLKRNFFKSEHLYGSYAIYNHMKSNDIPVRYISFDGYSHAPHEEKDGSFNENISTVKQEIIDFLFYQNPFYFTKM